MAVERTPAWIEPSPAVSRTPVYFGPPDAALFGWYHAPSIVAPQAHGAAVLCPPVGHEYTSAHRSLRHFADALASRGIATLRFDYPGTGDSAGSEDDPARVRAWVESVGHAIRAVRGWSGCDRVGLAGLRLGATLATLAARDADVAWLALWAPYARGRVFLRELKALGLHADRHEAGPRAIEGAGFRATVELQRELSAIDLTTIVPHALRVLIGERDDRAPDASLEVRWREAGVDVTRWTLPGFGEMVVAPHNTIVPAAAIRTIVDWIDNDAPRRPSPQRHARLRSPARLPALVSAGVRESTLRFGHGSLFGVVTEPESTAPAQLPAIVLSNAGAVHHTGPNRLYVDLARALAQAGFRSLRFDLPGLGDSVVDDRERPENVPYPPDASRTIECGLSALANLCGARTFVVMGLCSGAHAAFHAAGDLRHREIVEAVLINPLTFAYRPGMALDAPSDAHADRWQRYRQSMGSVAGWRKLLRPDTDVSAIARDVIARAAFMLKDRLSPFAESTTLTTPRTPVAEKLAQIAQLGRHVTLVCSRFDPGYDLLMLEAGSLARRLGKSRQLTTWVIENANHTFDTRAPRVALIESVTRHLTARYVARPRDQA